MPDRILLFHYYRKINQQDLLGARIFIKVIILQKWYLFLCHSGSFLYTLLLILYLITNATTGPGNYESIVWWTHCEYVGFCIIYRHWKGTGSLFIYLSPWKVMTHIFHMYRGWCCKMVIVIILFIDDFIDQTAGLNNTQKNSPENLQRNQDGIYNGPIFRSGTKLSIS